ncbi:hypothetical protein FN846DRAFT_959092 [Sphaerosporella brunnea]|uniref:Uncharacterized protein n=1 Tax=Sphaerosporella brunnea TaxID=1250544 RepID=A0A5J5EQ89_9PEZI|nr:hypothetical protein FN846DRAFT_959092 [Sphaerosporella brunnea]
MAPSSTARKRQTLAPNQPQITSFFSPQLPLPDDVASGLLSVGMRVRKSVPEGYKSGTYAFNKHLPSVLPGENTPPSSQDSVVSSNSSSSNNKRAFDDDDDGDEAEEEAEGVEKKKLPPPTSIIAWARRSVKVPTGPAGAAAAAKKKRGFHQAVGRREGDTVMAGTVDEDFGEAEFLLPMEEE